MGAFAERARRELLATRRDGVQAQVQTPSTLTAQETSIALLALDGRTNAEIGAQVFLGARSHERHG